MRKGDHLGQWGGVSGLYVGTGCPKNEITISWDVAKRIRSLLCTERPFIAISLLPAWAYEILTLLM